MHRETSVLGSRVALKQRVVVLIPLNAESDRKLEIRELCKSEVVSVVLVHEEGGGENGDQ